jgi:phosphonate transport system substrate-binding protein
MNEPQPPTSGMSPGTPPAAQSAPTPAASSAPPPAAQSARSSSWGFTLVLTLLLVAAAGGVYAYFRITNPPPPEPDKLASLRGYIANLGRTQTLAADYTDANGDLVADPPTDPAKFLRPEAVKELAFTVVGSEDPEKAQIQWKDFMLALEKATGRPVKYLAEVASVEDQVRAVREGRLHVTAFNTGQVSTAVNTAGFVPLFCIADNDGRYAYEMEILVRRDSPVQTPADLRGKTIGLTSLSSNSGGKAPLVVLKEKFGLLPGRDYDYRFTGDHVRAVKELSAGQYDAVCVANDQLARALAVGVVKPEQVRSIYKSETFPPLCFGVPHNLPPDIVERVKAAFRDFRFEGNSVGELYKSQGKNRFAPVDYARDWKLIREVDQALSRLLETD